MNRPFYLFALSTIVLAVLPGCLRQTCQPSEFAAYDARCELMAEAYRTGHPEQLCFLEMTDYFKRRLGMPVTDLEGLLGTPWVSVPENIYYNYALEDTIKSADEVGKLYPGTGYDRVHFYSELGPPDHRTPDGSFNLVFIVKNDRVVAIKTLFP